MKVKLTFYSPLLFIFLLFSCHKQNEDTIAGEAPNRENQLLAQQQFDKGSYYYNQNKFDSAFYYFNNSKNIFASEKDSLRAAFNLLMMARIQRLSSDYSGGESSATEALSYLRNINNLEYKRELLNILGMCYRKMYNYEQALEVYDQAIVIAEDSLSKCIIKNNIGTVYNDLNNPEKALQVLLPLTSSNVVKQDTITLARILNNIGVSYTLLNNPLALQHFKDGLQLRTIKKDQVGLLSSYLALADYYKNKSFSLAKDYANKAYNKAAVLNNPDDKLSALEILIQVDERNNDKYIEQYVHLNDSLSRVRATAKNEFVKIKYDSKVVQLENSDLKAQKQNLELEAIKDDNQKLVLVITLVFTAIVALLLMQLLKIRFKRNTLREVYKTETRISKTIHDEIANDVFNVMSFAENQDMTLKRNKDRVLTSLEKVYQKTRNISHSNGDIDTGPYYMIHLKELLSEYQSVHHNIIIKGLDEIPWDEIEEVKKVNVYRILQELMVNMKKHSNATLVVISFAKVKKQVEIKYADNGIGMPASDNVTRNGLLNVENRNKAINGTITFDSAPGKGCRITLKFPI